MLKSSALYYVWMDLAFSHKPLTSDAGSSEELVSLGDMSSVDGWHLIQYSGGQNAPTRFDIALFWSQNSTRMAHEVEWKRDEHTPLLRLRTPKSKEFLQSFLLGARCLASLCPPHPCIF
ncbi:hypothetical protein C1H46_015252 [Malus baccata]|uniref:Uncharacterized protein n=1 Tax=Malus baccata TaxID=106549 RepID=A0A540MK24_MALBA|nr:hypothetical protein C1H46_015252 [Malus baccata]